MPVEFSNDNKKVRLIQTCADYTLPWRNINPGIRNLCEGSINIIENNFPGFCWYSNQNSTSEWAYGQAGLECDHQFNINPPNHRSCIWCYPYRNTMNMRLWFPQERLADLISHPEYIANEFNHGSFYGLEIQLYKGNRGWYYIEYSGQDNYEKLIIELFNSLLIIKE